MWFFPLTFRGVGSEKSLLSGKIKLKLSESSWLEYLIFNKIFSVTKKIGKYIDFFNGSIFLNTTIIILIMLFLSF